MISGLAASSLIAASNAAAQQPQSLGRIQAEHAEPFTQVTAIRELADGRVIVSDRLEKTVQLINLTTGSALKVGREGSGPGEYALPTSLFTMPNDQTLLVDLLNRRFLLIGPDGKAGETISMPQLGGGAGGGGISISIPRASDGQGRLYFQDTGVRPGGESPDSVPLLRWTQGRTGMDTVAWTVGPRATVSRTSGPGGGTGVRLTMGMPEVFSPQEAWGVAADGRVARVTPAPYQVHWYGPNRRVTSGTPVPYTPIQVTEADKAAYREAQASNPPTMIMSTVGPGGRNSTQTVSPSALPEPVFAATKPAFNGSTSVLIAPEGEVWVLRNGTAKDPIPVYDVFDGTGKLARKVRLNAKERVVGFGKTSVYVSRTDEDDLQYLLRYSRPISGQP